jgi:glycosyltransferase involved in cell wall biosynthesis
MAPSQGEGFGIPVIEAQACGVPVIVSDFSAQPELVGSGWAVGGAPDWDEGQGAWFHAPSIDGILSALNEAYNGEGNPANARAKALEYDHNVVWDRYWRPIMTELERRITVPDVEATPINVGALG